MTRLTAPITLTTAAFVAAATVVALPQTSAAAAPGQKQATQGGGMQDSLRIGVGHSALSVGYC